MERTKRSRSGQCGLAGVVLEKVVPEHFSHFRHAHGRAGVAGIGFGDGVHGKGADGVGKFFTGRHGASFAGMLPLRKVFQR